MRTAGVHNGSELFPLEVGLWIQDHVEGVWLPDLTRMVNEHFGTSYTQRQIKSFKKNHRLSSGLTGQFQKGMHSPTKGKPQEAWMSPEAIERTKATRFKPGGLPHNTAPIGKEVVVRFKGGDRQCYIKVKVAQPNVWRWKHHLVWEEHNGPIPDKCCIDFRDGDWRNCDISNLICVSRGVHSVANLKGLRKAAGEAGLRLAALDEMIRKRQEENK